MFILVTRVTIILGVPVETPTYINMNNVTRFTAYTRAYYLQGEGTAQERQRSITLTSISFTAGVHEELDSIEVLETPEVIMNRGGHS